MVGSMRCVALVVLICLVGAGGASAAYPTYHSDPQRTGYAPGTGPEESTLRWIAPIGEFIGAPPVVDRGRVFVGVWPDMEFRAGEMYYFYCLDLATGEVLWKNPLGKGEGTVSGATVSGERVFVGCMDGKLYCIDRSTGATLWNIRVDDGEKDGNWYGLASSPIVEDGSVYVTSLTDGTLHALSLDGAELWTCRTGHPTFAYSSPAISEGQVFFAGNTGSNALHCIDTTTHRELWHTTVPGEIRSTPVIGSDTVYITSTSSLLAIDRENGNIRWTKPISASWGTPAIAGTSIYLGTRADSALHCIDTATGEERWSFTVNGKVDTSPVVTDNAVYCASNCATGTVYAIDTNGHELWHYATTDYIMSSPAVDEGTLFIGSDEGTLYAFGRTLMSLPGGSGLPADHDHDGRHEDVNGNGRSDFADVVILFNQMDWIAANEPIAAFDFNSNGRIDFADVVRLFNSL